MGRGEQPKTSTQPPTNHEPPPANHPRGMPLTVGFRGHRALSGRKFRWWRGLTTHEVRPVDAPLGVLCEEAAEERLELRTHPGPERQREGLGVRVHVTPERDRGWAGPGRIGVLAGDAGGAMGGVKHPMGGDAQRSGRLFG